MREEREKAAPSPTAQGLSDKRTTLLCYEQESNNKSLGCPMSDIRCTLLHFPDGTTAPEAAELFCGNLVVVVRRVTEWMAVQTARLSRTERGHCNLSNYIWE